MKIGVAQISPMKGNLAANIIRHQELIRLASSLGTDAVFFSELSLTSYEPELANALATSQYDKRLDTFQQISDTDKIIIGIGLPTRTKTGIRISMVIFQPGTARQTYSKQQLHSDELPFFENGDQQIMLRWGKEQIAPAICYESLQPNHVENASMLGANIYLASVAKSKNGIDKALSYFPALAKTYSMPVLMSNCLGYCDNFQSVGFSSVWTKQGRLVGQLDNQKEGVLIFDTETEEVTKQTI
jgi:predicted amidohydrolase